jgi:L-rhamnose mutarotase
MRATMNARILIRIAAVTLAAAASLVLIREVAAKSPARIERYGMVVGIKPEKIDEYKRLHAAAWPGVLAKIKECHIRNYSIYLREIEKGQYLLFSYFEYTGDDFAADMAKMAADPETQRWWRETDPCQSPIPTRGEKEFWSRMEEVFHTD